MKVKVQVTSVTAHANLSGFIVTNISCVGFNPTNVKNRKKKRNLQKDKHYI
jgi:predicted RNA-binding protein with EMAP domain